MRAGRGIWRSRTVAPAIMVALLAAVLVPRSGAAAAGGFSGNSSSPTTGILPGNPEDTSANVHIGLGAVTNISNCCAALQTATPPVGEVWDWNNGNPAAYPSIYKGEYFPADRQPDTRYNASAESLSWFVANHPDWLEFTCAAAGLTETQAIAAGDVAYAFGETTAIPLDTANPAVLSWVEQTFWGPAAASGDYGHLDFDNFQMDNSGSWSGQRCGHYSTSGAWVQQYTGTQDDPAYRQAEINLAAAIQNWLHATFPNVAFAANLSWSTDYVSDEEALLSHVDLWFDEQGFTNGNSGSPSEYLDGAWATKAQATAQFMAAGGRGWEDMNLEPSSSITTAQRQWALANYLLLKNDHSWVYVCPVSDCYDASTPLEFPEYAAAQVGMATDTYYADQGVYRRDFTNGLVLVNPSSTTSYTVSLTSTYQDLYGTPQSGSVTLTPGSGVVLTQAVGTNPTPTATATASPTVSPTDTPSPTAAPSPSPTPTNTPSPTSANTPSPTPTSTPAPRPTATSTRGFRAPSPAPTRTQLATPTRTASATPTRTSTPVPTPAPRGIPAGGTIVVIRSARPTNSSVMLGRSLSVTATLKNAGTANIALKDIAIAGRPPGGTNAGGPFDNFGPQPANVTLAPGQSYSTVQTGTFSATDPTGAWYCYLTYQTVDGAWHDDPTDGHFTVVP